MLTPEYLAKFSSVYLGMVDELNNEIVRDIARRITKTGHITETAKWQLKQAQESGRLLNDIVNDVGKFTGYSDAQIRKMFSDAGVLSLANDAAPLIGAGKATGAVMSPAMNNLMIANANKCIKDARNLTLTTASAGQNAYMQALNEAFMKVQSGAFSYQEALKQAIKNAAVGGATVLYDSGASTSLDAALRRSLLTGINQTAAKLTEIYANDMDVEYYETSAHGGARPSHAEWQGRIFKIRGASSDYPNFYDATGYGEVTGLCGVNCRHSFYPYWPGISKPAYSQSMLDDYEAAKYSYNGDELTEYECTQILRNYERNVRESKRILTGYDAAMKAATSEEDARYMKEAFSEESVKLKNKEKKMKDFCSQTSRKPDTARTQVHAVKDGNGNIVNYGRSTSMKAVWANRKANAK